MELRLLPRAGILSKWHSMSVTENEFGRMEGNAPEPELLLYSRRMKINNYFRNMTSRFDDRT